MCMQPTVFPNLVTGFDRNPQHAARAALYTRYTPSEWITSNISAYTESDINRFVNFVYNNIYNHFVEFRLNLNLKIYFISTSSAIENTYIRRSICCAAEHSFPLSYRG